MAKLLYSATMSLDGFIAGAGGDMSWLTEHLGPNPIAEDLIGNIGALLVGNRTFRGSDPHKGDPDKEGQAFGGGWEGPQFVLTHHAPDTQVPGVSVGTTYPPLAPRRPMTPRDQWSSSGSLPIPPRYDRRPPR